MTSFCAALRVPCSCALSPSLSQVFQAVPSVVFPLMHTGFATQALGPSLT